MSNKFLFDVCAILTSMAFDMVIKTEFCIVSVYPYTSDLPALAYSKSIGILGGKKYFTWWVMLGL